MYHPRLAQHRLKTVTTSSTSLVMLCTVTEHINFIKRVLHVKTLSSKSYIFTYYLFMFYMNLYYYCVYYYCCCCCFCYSCFVVLFFKLYYKESPNIFITYTFFSFLVLVVLCYVVYIYK